VLPCLEAWRELEDSPRITQPPFPARAEAAYLQQHRVFELEVGRQLDSTRPELAQKIRLILSEIDRIPEDRWLNTDRRTYLARVPLTPGEAFYAGMVVGRTCERVGVPT